MNSLIVDDNSKKLGILSACLSDYGFEILVDQDEISAIEKAEYAHPEIILLDMLMPGIEAFKLAVA